MGGGGVRVCVPGSCIHGLTDQDSSQAQELMVFDESYLDGKVEGRKEGGIGRGVCTRKRCDGMDGWTDADAWCDDVRMRYDKCLKCKISFFFLWIFLHDTRVGVAERELLSLDFSSFADDVGRER